MAALRYLLFAAVGLVVASVLFLVLSFLVSANFNAGVGIVERWIVKCDLRSVRAHGHGSRFARPAGSVRRRRGVVSRRAAHDAQQHRRHFRARGRRGRLRPAAAAQRAAARDGRRFSAEAYKPCRLKQGSVEVTLDAREFRP